MVTRNDLARLTDPGTAERAVREALAELETFPTDAYAMADAVAAALPADDDTDGPAAERAVVHVVRNHVKVLDDFADTFSAIEEAHTSGLVIDRLGYAKARLRHVSKRVEGMLSPYVVRAITAQWSSTREDEADSATWLPLDLSATSAERQSATVFRRPDGTGLLYRGKIHSMVGPSGSGKSWVALAAAAQVIADGERVLLVDFESEPSEIASRLVSLGIDCEALATQTVYIRPLTNLALPAAQRAFKRVLSQPFALAVLDGTTDSLMTMGLDGNKAEDVARWQRLLPRRIADETNAAVLMIDHQTKDSKGRGGAAIGSQHKRAGITGAQYEIRVASALSRGQRGVLELVLFKDRVGDVLQTSQIEGRAFKKNPRVASIAFDSTAEDGSTAVEVIGPFDDGRDEGPLTEPAFDSILLGRIRNHLIEHPGSVFSEVRARVGGKADRIHAHLLRLTELQQATVEQSGRSKRYFASDGNRHPRDIPLIGDEAGDLAYVGQPEPAASLAEQYRAQQATG